MRKFEVLFSVIILSVSSCRHEPFEPKTSPIPRDSTAIECDPDTVYFKQSVLPILSGCATAGCHDAATASDGVVLTSYEQIMLTADVRPGNAAGSDLYEVLIETDLEKRMPLGMPALSQEQIQRIRTWIEQGAKDNACAEEGTCDVSDYSYGSYVSDVLSDRGCIGCHNASVANGGVRLDQYDDVKTVALNGQLLGALKWDTGFAPMPQGQDQLDSCTIAKIELWINDGAPMN